MASLKEIERLVKQAENTILAGNSAYAMENFWPGIEGAIHNCDELTCEESIDLVLITEDHLNKLGLQATTGEEPIDSIDELRERTPPPNPPVTWIPG